MNNGNKNLETGKNTNNKGLKIALIIVSVALVLLVGYLIGSKSANDERTEKIDKSEVIKKEDNKSKTENVEFKYDINEATMIIDGEETYYADLTDNIKSIEKEEIYTSSVKDSNNKTVKTFEKGILSNTNKDNIEFQKKFHDYDEFTGIDYVKIHDLKSNKETIYFKSFLTVEDKSIQTVVSKFDNKYLYLNHFDSENGQDILLKLVKNANDENAQDIAKIQPTDGTEDGKSMKFKIDNINNSENVDIDEYFLSYLIFEHQSVDFDSEEEVSKSDSSSDDFDFSNVKFDDNFIRISNNQTNFYASDTLMYQVQMLKDKIYPQRYYVKNGRDSGLVSAEFIKNPVEHFMNLVKDDGSSLRYDEVVINTDDYDKIRIYKDSVVNEHIIITLKNGELLATVNASLDLKEDIRLKTSKLTFRTKDFENAIKNQDVTQVYNPSASIDSPFIHVEKDPSITNLGMDKYLEDADTFVLFNEDKSDSYSIIMNQINVDDDYINTAIATLVAIDQQFIFKDIEYNK